MKFNKQFALYFISGYFALGEAITGIIIGSPYKIFHVSVGGLVCNYIWIFNGSERMRDYLEDLNKFREWFNKLNGDVSSVDCFRFGLTFGCKDTKDKILNFIELNKFSPIETINFINKRHSRGFWINTEDLIKELSGSETRE